MSNLPPSPHWEEVPLPLEVAESPPHPLPKRRKKSERCGRCLLEGKKKPNSSTFDAFGRPTGLCKNHQLDSAHGRLKEL